MIKELEEHFFEYLVLVCYTVVSLFFLLVQHTQQGKFVILALFILFYFLWSVFHHIQQIKKISVGVMLEYILLTVFGILVLKVLFFPNV